jgi:predicted nicotinamide N-methyase
MSLDLPSTRPPMPETPADALGLIVREKVILDEHTFILERPTGTDHLLDHPAVRSAFASDDYMPYWADLWPAARMLAKFLLRQKWASGLRALEVGCGLGLPGIAALKAGLHVTFSDCDATALRFASANAKLNGLADFDTLQLDWRYPPEGLKWPVVVASDLIYEMRNVAPLVGLIKAVLAPEGECLLTDQDRVPSQVLRDTLAAEGMPFTTQAMRAGEPGGRRLRGTLYRIRAPR